MDLFDRDLVMTLCSREQTIHELCKRFKKRDSFVRYRIGALAEDGIVRRRSVGDKDLYYVPIDDITYGDAKVVVKTKHKLVTVDLGPVLIVNVKGWRQIVTLT